MLAITDAPPEAEVSRRLSVPEWPGVTRAASYGRQIVGPQC
jgi:hypothetical protein